MMNMKRLKNKNGGFFTPMFPIFIAAALLIISGIIYWIMH